MHFTEPPTRIYLAHLTALVVGAGQLLHGVEVCLAAAVPVAALSALAPRALLVLVAHLVRVGVQTDAVGHRASILVAEASGPLVLGVVNGRVRVMT